MHPFDVDPRYGHGSSCEAATKARIVSQAFLSTKLLTFVHSTTVWHNDPRTSNRPKLAHGAQSEWDAAILDSAARAPHTRYGGHAAGADASLAVNSFGDVNFVVAPVLVP